MVFLLCILYKSEVAYHELIDICPTSEVLAVAHHHIPTIARFSKSCGAPGKHILKMSCCCCKKLNITLILNYTALKLFRIYKQYTL